jgi:TatD DNase family protein
MRTPLVGEVGLDSVYQVPLDLQIKTFRQVLEVVQDLPRLTSIHSYQTCQLLLDELTTRPIIAPVLHWWTGTTAETRQAVALGCYFSIHSQVARQSKWRTQVPLERVLVESDHGYNDPPPAIPHRVAWVEYLVAQQYRIGVEELRRVVWRNFARIVVQSGTLYLFPEELAALVEANTE